MIINPEQLVKSIKMFSFSLNYPNILLEVLMDSIEGKDIPKEKYEQIITLFYLESKSE